MDADKLMDSITSEWKSMHHNARIRKFPEFRNDYEAELFWNALSGNLTFWLDDLSEQIKESYGYDWKFYQYGRNGATIAPDELNDGGGRFGPIKIDAIPEDYDEMVKFHEALQFVNDYWKELGLKISEWWTGMKEDNEMEEIIKEYDGKHKVMVEKWVD